VAARDDPPELVVGVSDAVLGFVRPATVESRLYLSFDPLAVVLVDRRDEPIERDALASRVRIDTELLGERRPRYQPIFLNVPLPDTDRPGLDRRFEPFFRPLEVPLVLALSGDVRDGPDRSNRLPVSVVIKLAPSLDPALLAIDALDPTVELPRARPKRLLERALDERPVARVDVIEEDIEAPVRTGLLVAEDSVVLSRTDRRITGL
jgi:hypothetical protein